MVIYKNGYFSLTSHHQKLYITVYKPGFKLSSFNQIVIDLPVIQITNFFSLRDALENADGKLQDIGMLRPRIEVIISSDEMEAKIKLNISAKEFATNKVNICSEIVSSLASSGIKEGILLETLDSPIPVQKEILIAKGKVPVDGEDSKITYFQISDKKPFVKNDGSINYYELNLIDNVKKDDWLGERLPPTEGEKGITVTGKILLPKKGRKLPLKYDSQTVKAVEENGKTVLRALADGAVIIEYGKIKVQNHLMIYGDVGFDTGNIDFDGSVTIKGTIKDGFSVCAQQDISILGQLGLGAVEKIISREGSIYIRGGIYGKSVAKIEAKKNVYAKYCNECSITAGENIHIGFYVLDSNLSAKNIFTDELNGIIIGGTINADIQIISGTIGNKMERKTFVNVRGFDRLKVKENLEQILGQYNNLLEKAEKLQRQLEVYENTFSGAEYGNVQEYNNLEKRYHHVIEDMNVLSIEAKKLQKVLQTKGEGEIEIFKAAYPQTFIKIKEMEKTIRSLINGKFYIMNNELYYN